MNDAKSSSDVAVCVMSMGRGQGRCFIGYQRENTTNWKVEIKKSIAKQANGKSTFQKDRVKFFRQCLEALHMKIKFADISSLVILSSGFVNEQFRQFVFEHVKSNPNDSISKDMKPSMHQIVCAPCAADMAPNDAVLQMFQNPAILEKMQETAGVKMQKRYDEFDKTYSGDNFNKCLIGINMLRAANKLKQIDFAMISDSKLRSYDFQERNRLQKLIRRIKRNRGEVVIVPSTHALGKTIDNDHMGAIALMRVAMDLWDYMEDDEVEKVQENEQKLQERKKAEAPEDEFEDGEKFEEGSGDDIFGGSDFRNGEEGAGFKEFGQKEEE